MADPDQAGIASGAHCSFLLRILDALEQPFYVFQASDHRVVYANAHAGGTSALGQTCHRLSHGKDAPCDSRDHPCPLQILRQTKSSVVVEHQHRVAGGEVRSFDVHAHPIFDEDGELEHVIEFSVDVSDRIALQAQLAHADRLVTMGTLAAGLAHELRGPLTYISGNLVLLEESIAELDGATFEDARSELLEMLHDSKTGAKSMEEIVAGVRTFSRSGDLDPVEVDLVRVIETARRIAHSEIKYRATLEVELGDLPTVRGREGQLGQVFLNLLVNAAQALEKGDSSNNRIAVRASSSDTHVVVEISDTGCGIERANLERVFDAFFTTKPPSTGTGLGLHICRQIVRDHGGSLRLESEVGVGSTFTVQLPRFDPS